ncbi:adenine nucleotide alpha hydrolase [Vannielia litorea]|uniref:Dph6-related ATP pyrophosphatase n=1 Tax=Vannielia litorea TaxID=1217970 RepID=UPI001C9739C4|nr:adenine nucleotide alpha hydrolase [Vannielia litorea]MBY6046563.1 adenine nucleotide alpha hydrolase [Vannielia litorea]MBY6073976.1 adenine nucleotide alpha hydrolase [Vannielia litorea]
MTAAIGWSSGKDACMALIRARAAGYDVTTALTTLNEAFDRVAMHGTRAAILRAQAEAAGLELLEVPLPWPCTNEIYEARMAEAVEALKAKGITQMIFGDLFLEDVRDYRIAQLEGTGIAPVFPLWGEDTATLAREVAESFDTRIVTLDPSKLPEALAGRRLDAALLLELPDGVDPCGENGEFHTCVLDAPCFRTPVPATRGETVTRDGFVYSDLVLTGT